LAQLFFLLALEVSLFFLNNLRVDLESGWFAQPSRGEASILAGLLTLAITFGWLAWNAESIKSYPNWINKILHPNCSNFKPLFLLGILIFGLSIILCLPSRTDFPPILRLVLKHKDLIGLFLVIGIEILAVIMAKRFPIVKMVLMKIGSFVYRYALLLIFGLLVCIKLAFLVPISRGLLVLNDTYLYWMMAKQILEGSLDVSQYNHYPPLFSIVISPILQFGLRDSLRNLTIFNVLISSTAIFPLYLIAREFLDKKISLLLTLACAAFPFHIVYPAILFSENFYYPLFFWGFYFTVSYPKRNKLTWLWDVLLGVSLAAMWLTRYMTWPLIPVFLMVWWLKNKNNINDLQFRPNREKILRLVVILTIIIALNGIWILAGMLNGVELKSMLGFPPGTGGSPDRLSFHRLLFWIGVTTAYLCLILAPVLHVFINAIISWKKIKWTGQLVRWFLIVAGISGMLLVEVTRHAWRAVYNFPDPTKYVGRYVLYISALVWLTAIILIKEKLSITKRVLYATGIFSGISTYLCYQLFYNQNWMLKDFILNYRFVDVFSISFLQWIYIVVIIAIIIVSSLIMYKNTNSASAFLISGILCLNLVVWPGYIKTLVFYETNARHLDEMLDHIVFTNEQSTDQYTLYVPKGGNFYDEELEVRGYDPNIFIIEEKTKEPLRKYNCKARLMLQYSNGRRIVVIDQSINCNLPDHTELSTYVYNEKEYQLIELPAQ
jgi:hypothetical protein